MSIGRGIGGGAGFGIVADGHCGQNTFGIEHFATPLIVLATSSR
ncbi:hypothetical protein MIZ01_1989 [Sideroxyarcus emersonii]|uniref:Uncharacterized protein n=1 Tax=Sideroxyarcus emersonii TaxID=2764705 RepID=A0AAN1XBS2_9PROT|nr:hypothetical protein MIZ01_1989 [Sideroxyarcus emersonii]